MEKEKANYILQKSLNEYKQLLNLRNDIKKWLIYDGIQ